MGWWQRYPDRLKNEVERLKARGFTTAFDPAAFNGKVVEISGTLVLAGHEYPLRIIFPDLYPYFRPQVYSTALSVPHHQNPFDANLCLLGRNSDNWHPDNYVGDILVEQLPKLLASEAAFTGGGHPEEELQAEPWTEYLAPVFDFRIAWNSDITVPAGSHGQVELTYKPQEEVFRAFVSGVTQSGGNKLFTEQVALVPDAKTKMSVPYVRLNTVPPVDHQQLVPLIEDALGQYNPAGNVRRLTTRTQGALMALFFPEETAHRIDGMGLVFVLFVRSRSSGIVAHYIKPYRAGEKQVAARLAAYGDIRDHRMLLIGFGSLGSALAANLCKLGLRDLVIVDRDVFEPGNTARHYLGMQAFGTDKTEAGAGALATAYPYTRVKAVSYKLGDGGEEAAARTNEFLAELDAADVVVDCTAERAVQHFLSDEAWFQKKRYFMAEAYPGVLGGFVGSIEPGKGPCLLCFLEARASGALPPPPMPKEATIQPAGCGEPTFIGTPFDAETIADAAARLIFATLSSKEYPKAIQPFYRIALASPDANQSLVSIEPIQIPKRAGCDKCGNA